MFRTRFSILAPPERKDATFFVEMPARVVVGDSVTVWPLMPVELAAQPAQAWLQNEGVFEVTSACWSRDEQGVYLTALLFRQES